MLTLVRSRRSVTLAVSVSFALAATVVFVLRPGSGDAAPTCRQVSMYAEKLPNDDGQTRLGFGLTPGTASIPGPLIEMNEGECLKIRLRNDVPRSTLEDLRNQYGGESDLPLAVSIHPHGVKYQRESDGTVSSDSYVLPGETRTFTWIASDHTAGYWWYHDHVVGTEHGTGGLATGLWGGLIVRRKGDLRPDVPTFVVAMGDGFTINLKRYPDTPTFHAKMGQRIEFLVFAWGNETHAFHLHGHNWADNRTGIFTDDPEERAVDNVTLAPASSFGFQTVAGRISGPNMWMYHCHVQFHSDQGMMGFLDVEPA